MPLPAFLPSTPIPLPNRTPLPLPLTSPRRPIPRPSMSLLSHLITRARDDTALLITHSTNALSLAAIVAALALPLNDALAASAGGRVGGSSFRSAPTRVVPRAPSGAYGGAYGGGGYYGGYAPGGLLINPFVLPIGVGGFGIGGFGSLLLFASALGVVTNFLQQRAEEKGLEEVVDPTMAVAVFKVGLLATARQLQVDLDMLARQADTGNVEGLRRVLGETVTSLLRHPDYWVYGSVHVEAAKLSKAEGVFNRLCLQERVKLGEETLVNVGGGKRESDRANARQGDLEKGPGEFIVVSLVVAGEGGLITRLPKIIDSGGDVERALRALGELGGDGLQAVEVVWAPQSLKDVLSEREMLTDHPELRRL